MQFTCTRRNPVGARCSTLLQCESLHCANGVCIAATMENTFCFPY
jgi:hypothetical protein